MARIFGLAVLMAAISIVMLFVVAPLYAALDAGRAVATGDVVTLERRVDWAGVRESLKTSLAEHDRGMRNADRGAPRPSLWMRVKMAVTSSRYGENMIDRVLTPSGIVQLARSQAPKDVMSAVAPSLTRAMLLWSSLSRVGLRDHATLDVEVRDTKDRRFIGTLARDGLTWRLVSVRLGGG